jgi:Uma2 family endonuclease
MVSASDSATRRVSAVTARRPLLASLRDVPLPTSAAEPSVMGMPRTTGHWTRDQVWALPDDGRRYELIDGELVVTPSPGGPHQVAAAELFHRLRLALDRAGTTSARVLFSPADLSLGEEEILQPDLFIYRLDHPVTEWRDITSLLVAIEVLSPSTARYDRGLKRLRYQRARVPDYWIVDLDGRVVERWRPDDSRPEVLGDRLRWVSGDGAELDLDLQEFFRQVAGE